MATFIKLRDVPDDIFSIIIQEQADTKKKRKNGHFSLELAIYKIIREHQELKTKGLVPIPQ